MLSKIFPCFALIVFLIACIAPPASAQKEDYIWVIGEETCGFPNQGSVDMDFHGDTMRFFLSCRNLPVNRTNASICDAEGRLEFHTNGYAIKNAANGIVENGDSLGTFDIYSFEDFYESGSLVHQGALMLVQPGHDSLVYLFKVDGSYFGDYAPLNYTVINRNANGGLGRVVQRDQQMVLDTLYYLGANRHANGRDWWIIVSSSASNRYYRWLFDPSGVHGPYIQDYGFVYEQNQFDWSGQATFSPDGQWYAKRAGVRSGAFLYRFDRCTGLLSDETPMDTLWPPSYNINHVSGGVAFSPSGRYLYKSNALNLFQYDLSLPNPFDHGILVDTFDWFANPLNNTFFIMRVGPDGKIYMCATSSFYHLHVIHAPERGGTACNFVKRGIDIPTEVWSGGIPNFPHYRLGPLDGSACDTLGLDQPLAAHAERLDFGPVPLGSAATLSFWLRNPGEGALVVDTFRFDSAQYASPLPLPFTVAPGDSVQVPVTFAPTALPMVEAQLRVFHNGIAGISTVQLTGLGDSVVSALPAAAAAAELVLWPNPTSGAVQVAFTSARAFDTEAVLYDALGRAVLALPVQVVAGSNRFALPLEGLPGGVYSVMLRGVGAGRVVKH